MLKLTPAIHATGSSSTGNAISPEGSITKLDVRTVIMGFVFLLIELFLFVEFGTANGLLNCPFPTARKQPKNVARLGSACLVGTLNPTLRGENKVILVSLASDKQLQDQISGSADFLFGLCFIGWSIPPRT
jgi:hypothetical protein